MWKGSTRGGKPRALGPQGFCGASSGWVACTVFPDILGHATLPVTTQGKGGEVLNVAPPQAPRSRACTPRGATTLAPGQQAKGKSQEETWGTVGGGPS